MLVDPYITYMFALPDWRPHEISPFQGFAPGLLDQVPALQRLVRFPGDVYEYTMLRPDRLARRAGGVGGWRWVPFNASELARLEIPPTSPLWVIFSCDEAVARTVEIWQRSQPLKPLHVSSIQGDNINELDAFTIDQLAEHCRGTLQTARGLQPGLEVDRCLQAIDQWRSPSSAPSPLAFESHNATVPNEMVLASEGFERCQGPCLAGEGEGNYVAAIEASAQQVRALRKEAGDPIAFRADPPRPAVILLAPAIYHVLEEGLAPATAQAPPGFREAIRALRRQKGYNFTLTNPLVATQPGFRWAMNLRRRELQTQSAAVGLRGASTVAATLRLPGSVNRTAGTVAHLCQHLRQKGPRPVKTARVFKAAQRALAQAVDPRFMDIIRTSVSGVKIYGDAPLEWLPVDGLPLGIRADVSRINATPGALTFAELATPATLYLEPDAFLQYLVISSFRHDDPIRNHLRIGLKVLARQAGVRFAGRFVDVCTTEGLIGVLNAFEGPIVVFDTHGQHHGHIGVLNIGDDQVDIWALRTRVRIPPIVILSACDTHPPDRSHATVANGFIYCGARCVLATMLPVRATPAAAMIARLLLRAVDFTAAAIGSGRAVPWTQVVGGLFRMQFASELALGLAARGWISGDEARALHFQANMLINQLNPQWFEELAGACRAAANISEEVWASYLDDTLAASDVIRYLHLGNPETVVIRTDELARRIYGD